MSNDTVYCLRPRPIHGRWSSHVASWHIVQNSQFRENTTGNYVLTVGIIGIMILLKPSRERDEVPIAHAQRPPPLEKFLCALLVGATPPPQMGLRIGIFTIADLVHSPAAGITF
ncbi:hypothetical protein TNCV_5013161 [Trichonephila clavipes]|nr:hypothetical protein TNCV_5013161 [Trichonephila clavipes]